jgi:hypothetical protein
MTQEPTSIPPIDPELEALGAAPDKPLAPAARRALEEAAARRAVAVPQGEPHENGGPRGLEPTRFGDWERKGLAVDF